MGKRRWYSHYFQIHHLCRWFLFLGFSVGHRVDTAWILIGIGRDTAWIWLCGYVDTSWITFFSPFYHSFSSILFYAPCILRYFVSHRYVDLQARHSSLRVFTEMVLPNPPGTSQLAAGFYGNGLFTRFDCITTERVLR